MSPPNFEHFWRININKVVVLNENHGAGGWFLDQQQSLLETCLSGEQVTSDLHYVEDKKKAINITTSRDCPENGWGSNLFMCRPFWGEKRETDKQNPQES